MKIKNKTMKAIKGKVLIKMDTTQKERYDLGNGSTLYIEKGYEFNRRLDKPSMAVIINGEGLPAGEEILVHHNASEATYEVEGVLTHDELASGYRIFSIPADMCFCYKKNDEWIPCENFVISERIFKPYKGALIGINHEQIKNRLYITKGAIEWDGRKENLSGKVCIVTENSDYQIIWHDRSNKIQNLIRTRHREVMAIDHDMGKKIKKGELLVGITAETAKKLSHDN